MPSLFTALSSHLPDGVPSCAEVVHLLVIVIVVLINDAVPVGVVGRVEISHGTRGYPQDPQHGQQHTREHPALTILHGLPSRLVVLLQDLATPSPEGRTLSIIVVPVPPPNQNTILVLDVHESRHLPGDLNGITLLLKRQLGLVLQKEENGSKAVGAVECQIPRRPVEVSDVELSTVVKDVLPSQPVVFHVDGVVCGPGVEQHDHLLLEGNAEFLSIFELTSDVQSVESDGRLCWDADLLIAEIIIMTVANIHVHVSIISIIDNCMLHNMKPVVVNELQNVLGKHVFTQGSHR